MAKMAVELEIFGVHVNISEPKKLKLECIAF